MSFSKSPGFLFLIPLCVSSEWKAAGRDITAVTLLAGRRSGARRAAVKQLGLLVRVPDLCSTSPDATETGRGLKTLESWRGHISFIYVCVCVCKYMETNGNTCRYTDNTPTVRIEERDLQKLQDDLLCKLKMRKIRKAVL